MKKSVKLILLSALGMVSVLSVATLSSCKRDKCKAIACQHEGVCNDDGSCQCRPGFEGSMCEVTTRDKYTGVWQVDENGTSTGRHNYIVAIEHSLVKGANYADVQITNMNNTINGRVNATVQGDTIYIPTQTIDGKTIEGIGVLHNDTYYGEHGALTLRYRIFYNDTKSESDYGYIIGEPSEWHK
jgi:hypothetical protein